jgi:hypothetical protein
MSEVCAEPSLPDERSESRALEEAAELRKSLGLI